MNNSLFVKSVIYNKQKVEDENVYPFNIPAFRKMKEINFSKNVNFFVGENGTGKSTLIEAIAIKLGLNPEGGNQNTNFSTKNTHSNLFEYLTISTNGLIPKSKFFLRAESFYNLASWIDNLDISNYYGGSLHECSHGESFLKLIENKFFNNGLYILDEPEAALSPTKQMTLLCLINDLSKNGSQFLIATHSPILLSYKDATIFDLDNDLRIIDYKETSIYQTYKLFLDNPDKMLFYLLKK